MKQKHGKESRLSGYYAGFVMIGMIVGSMKVSSNTSPKGERNMKAVKLDLNLDVEKVKEKFLLKEPSGEQRIERQKKLKDWAELPPEQRGQRPDIEEGYMTTAEFFVETIGGAIRQAHPNGNVQVLRRTTKILSDLKGAIESEEKKGVAILELDDYKYIKSAFAKADKWINDADNAEVLMLCYKHIEDAEEIEL